MKTILNRFVLVAASCTLFLMAGTGCTVLTAITANSEYATIQMVPASAVNQQKAAVITQHLLGVVDRIAHEHALQRRDIPATFKLDKSDTFLRDYDKLDSSFVVRYSVGMSVYLEKDHSIPTVNIGGGTGAGSEIKRLAKEIDEALRREVKGVEFRLEIHSYFSFA